MTITLIIGGARSGKSDYGQAMGESGREPVLFVATAQAFDDEMQRRIRKHQDDRPDHWLTLEAPKDLSQQLQKPEYSSVQTIVIDCITLLASNVLLTLPDPENEEAADLAMRAETQALLALMQTSSADWILITNEVGLGIVPNNRLARIYRDILGRANQQLAAAANQVIWMVAGIPQIIKPK